MEFQTINEGLSMAEAQAQMEPQRMFTWVELLEGAPEEDPSKCLIEPYFRKGTMSGIVAAPDSGKSLLALHMATAIALGEEEAFGLPIHAVHGRAIYATTEDGHAELAERIRNQLDGRGRHASGDALKVLLATDLHELCNDLAVVLEDQPHDLIIVDAFGDIVEGDENSNTHVRNTFKHFQKLAWKHNTHILFVHHIRKSAHDEAPKLMNAQGAGAFGAKLRTVLQLFRVKGTDLSYLVLLKDNGLPRSEKEEAMVLQLDEGSLLHSFTGDTVTVEQIKGSGPLKPSKKVDLNALVSGTQTLSRKELLALCKGADVPKSSAYRYLKSIPTNGDGLYILNN